MLEQEPATDLAEVVLDGGASQQHSSGALQGQQGCYGLAALGSLQPASGLSLSEDASQLGQACTRYTDS